MGKKEIIKQLKLFKKKASKEVAIDRLIFFGSRAHGKPTKDSDIDLIVVSSSFNRKKSWKRGINLRKYWDLDFPVDFICYTPKEFEELSRLATIVRTARKEGIII